MLSWLVCIKTLKSSPRNTIKDSRLSRGKKCLGYIFWCRRQFIQDYRPKIPGKGKKNGSILVLKLRVNSYFTAIVFPAARRLGVTRDVNVHCSAHHCAHLEREFPVGTAAIGQTRMGDSHVLAACTSYSLFVSENKSV